MSGEGAAAAVEGTLDIRDDEDFRLIYATLASRRTSYESFMVNTPALTLAAQSVLLGVALSGKVSPWVRVGSGAVALVLSLVITQVLVKNRYLERLDTEMLKTLESHRGLPPIHGPADIRAELGDYEFTSGVHRWVARRRSFRVWLVTLASSAVVSLAITVGALLHAT